MNDATKSTLAALATARAAKLCADALASLAQGRKTFVKGKPVFVPFSDEARTQRKHLQLSAFEPGMQVEMIVLDAIDVLAEGATDVESEERIVAEAIAVYCEAGRAEVERLWTAG